MPRAAVVLSDDDDDDEAPRDVGFARSAAEERNDDSDPEAAHEHGLDLLLVEALELSMRNVPLHGEYLQRAEASFRNWQTLSRVLFEQALSPRWNGRFVAVLRRTRMVRVRYTACGDHHAEPDSGFGCRACGQGWEAAPRIGARNNRALELVAGAARDFDKVSLREMMSAFDQQEERDKRLCRTHADEAYLGLYVTGGRCFDLAMAAVLAKNLVLDTCDDILQELERRLQDPAVRAHLERDEQDPTRPIHALTPVRDIAERTHARASAVRDVLRGCEFPDGKHRQTGPPAVWRRLDRALATHHHVSARHVRYARERGDGLLGFWDDGSGDPPLLADGAPEPPVSSRTRAKARSRRAVTDNARELSGVVQ